NVAQPGADAAEAATSPAQAPAERPTGRAAPPAVGASERAIAPLPLTSTAARVREQAPAAPPPPSGGLLERLSQRARARRRLTWHRAGLAAAGLVVVAAIAWLVLASPVLTLREDAIEVHGAGSGTTVASAQVSDVVAGYLGTPLARLDTDAVAADIGQLTQVRDVTVQRSWPHGIIVDIEARVAVATIADGDGFAALDVDGVSLGSSEEPPADLPLVDLPQAEDRASATLQAVLEVLAALPQQLRDDVAVAGGQSPGAIELQLVDGATVRWGDAQDSELKVAVLDVMRDEPARVYDLTVPQAPTATG
ncbi:MAG TPA: cell division protein FtsQ/DivIB, partial [Actinomycetaceae bacterium]|nr:cell division protein FtsQ/DivIB [Actinomycetaceae bacterium]